MDQASETFISQAINLLQMATDKYGKVGYDSKYEIREIIERLEFILEKEGV